MFDATRRLGRDASALACNKRTYLTRLHTLSLQGMAQPPFALLGCVSLIFQPMPKPAVNDLPLVANHTEIEKVRPFFL